MKIRVGTLRDAAAISRLSGQLGYPAGIGSVEKELSAILHDPDHCVLIVEDGQADITGWIHVFKTKRVFMEAFAEIGGFVVDEASRGKGLGLALLKAAEEWAQRKRCSVMLIRSNVVRRQAHAFYEGFGYSLFKRQEVFRKVLES